ncbi:MAG TPA: DinB family protein [Pyrinomonadaceae bacterium]|nr:DinB family protein [Pyrinomonadaceae bacterium]
MTETERIKDQLRRAFEGEAWHGPSLREVLDGVTAERAALKPLAAAHSIWEIVNHLAAWNGAVRQRIKGARIETPDEGDWPPVVDKSEAAWAVALEWLAASHHELYEAVGALSDSVLDEPMREGGASSFYLTLQGTIQHYAYHAGQIALLKKDSAAT